MIKSVTIKNSLGEWVKINLSEGDPEHGFIIKEIEGLGPPKANINNTDLATLDGSIHNSARVEERNIIMRLLFTDAGNIEDTRQRTYKYFPIKKLIEFLIETDNRILSTNGYVESNEPNIFSQYEETQISIVCPDPYFCSAGKDGNTVTVFFSITPLFEFPFSNESLTEKLIEFGSIENYAEKNIWYGGDADVGIKITIHALGPATDITIYNLGTRETMRIDTTKLAAIVGGPIKASDDIIINTVRGEKSITFIRDAVAYNILNAVGRDADWFQLTRGDNVFAYTAETGAGNLQFKIENKTLFEGV